MHTALKHLLVGFSFMVIGRIFSYAIYTYVFYPNAMEYIRIYRPLKEWQWPLLLPLDFLIGVAFSLTYVWIKKNLQKPLCPYRFAFFYAIISRFFAEFSNYIFFPISTEVLIAGCAVALCTFLSGGFILKIVHKNPKITI